MGHSSEMVDPFDRGIAEEIGPRLLRIRKFCRSGFFVNADGHDAPEPEPS
jgi:hypothetical protein